VPVPVISASSSREEYSAWASKNLLHTLHSLEEQLSANMIEHEQPTLQAVVSCSDHLLPRRSSSPVLPIPPSFGSAVSSSCRARSASCPPLRSLYIKRETIPRYRVVHQLDWRRFFFKGTRKDLKI
jgi:hypothetical protein